MLNQTLNKENIFSIIYLKNKSSHLYFDKPISGTLYYKNYKVDILTWKRSPCSLEHLSSQFRKIKMDNNFEKPIVFHLCYEFGFFFVGEKERILDEDLLAVEIHYEKVSQIQLDNCKTKIQFKLLESPNKEKYKKAYTLGREELLAGNCYQYNLTYPFKYNYDGDITKDLFGDLISTFLNGVERNGAYCHVTNIPLLQKMILSNSPECLFQGKSYKN
jgi:anthranilate/para-aminobenzoate synthase component I